MTPQEEKSTYLRITRGLIRELKKLGGYVPAVDNIQIEIIAHAYINMKKSQAPLNADTATEYTHVRIADCQAKYAKIIQTALSELGLSRRNRLTMPAPPPQEQLYRLERRPLTERIMEQAKRDDEADRVAGRGFYSKD